MKGYLAIQVVNYEAWHEQAKADYVAQTGDDSIESYTYTTPDVSPDWVWVRVEHDFIEGDVKTKEEAVSLGMISE